MKINEKTLFEFARSRPVDREGFLLKRGEVNKAWQKRFFVLKGNLLFYYEKKGNAEPLGMVILEGCLVELCEYEDERFCFSISFPGNRRYILAAENQESMELWMKNLTTAGYDYMRLMISELQRQLAEIDSSSQQNGLEQSAPAPPIRQNPFNRGGYPQITPPQIPQRTAPAPQAPLRPAPPPPGAKSPPINRDSVAHTIRDDNELLMFSQKPQPQTTSDDFTFLTVHEYFGKAWQEVIKSRQDAKAKTETPLIVL